MKTSFFDGQTYDEDRLIAFGFIPKNDGWQYAVPIMDDDLLFTLFVTPSDIRLTVTDAVLGDEYALCYDEGSIGGYVGEVRRQTNLLLTAIAEHCFHPIRQHAPLPDLIARTAKEEWNESPEYLFDEEKSVGGFVLRHAQTGKWYAIVMHVKHSSLKNADRSPAFPHQKDEIATIVNVKHDKDAIPSLWNGQTILPAYHMNKTYWLTLYLDGDLSEEQLLTFLRRSRELVGR